jgi:hypothetical protein
MRRSRLRCRTTATASQSCAAQCTALRGRTAARFGNARSVYWSSTRASLTCCCVCAPTLCRTRATAAALMQRVVLCVPCAAQSKLACAVAVLRPVRVA